MCQSSLIFLLTHPHTSSLLSQDYFLSRGKKGSTLCHVQGKPFSIATLLSARKGEAEEHWARSQDLILASHQLAVQCRSHPLTSLGLAAHTLLISWGGLPIKWENRKKKSSCPRKGATQGLDLPRSIPGPRRGSGIQKVFNKCSLCGINTLNTAICSTCFLHSTYIFQRLIKR